MVDASRNLGAGFEVRQGLEDLPGEFVIRRSTSTTLKAGFEGMVRINLAGAFIVRHSDLQDLPGEFIVRHSDLQELKAGFDGQAISDLPGEFIVRQLRVITLRAGFNVPAMLNLLGEFEVRHDTSQTLPAGFEVRNEGTPIELKGEFTVRQLTSEDLAARFIVRPEPSVNLKAGMNIVHWEDLRAGFSIPLVLFSCETIINEDDFETWLNYIEPIGTGFLSYPRITNDAIIKFSGVDSGRIEIDQLRRQGYKEITFGWRWMPSRLPAGLSILRSGMNVSHPSGPGYISLEPGISLIVDSPSGHGGGYAEAYGPGVKMEVDDPVGRGGIYFKRT